MLSLCCCVQYLNNGHVCQNRTVIHCPPWESLLLHRCPPVRWTKQLVFCCCGGGIVVFWHCMMDPDFVRRSRFENPNRYFHFSDFLAQISRWHGIVFAVLNHDTFHLKMRFFLLSRFFNIVFFLFRWLWFMTSIC